MATVASRQVANSAWLAELSKIAAKSVTTYKSTSRIIPMIAKICLEGIFVLEEYKKRGYAKELLGECQNWAKDQGCLEFASDCELDNEDSLKFHLKMGFAEANRIICFTKSLTDLEE